MNTVPTARARTESVRSIAPATHKRKSFIRTTLERTGRFFERNRTQSMIALGTIATAYGVVKGHGDVEALSSQLEALGSSFINKQAALPETHIAQTMRGISTSSISVAAGATLFMGAVARSQRHTPAPQEVLSSGLFVAEQPQQQLIEETRSLVPERQEPGLYAVRGGMTGQPPAPVHATLDTLLARAA